MLTVKEVAAELRVGVGKVRAWIRSRQLRASDVSASPGSRKRRYVVSREALEAFLRSREPEPPKGAPPRRPPVPRRYF